MTSSASPIVKWAGGKGKLLAEIRRRLPKEIGTYYEPFVGGGAVFFALANRGVFERAVINDSNPELICTYRCLADGQVEDLIELLSSYPYNPEFFSELREKLPKDLDPLETAARFLYLNKTCYNGLYRVNKKGGFNSPFGAYTNPTICNKEGLREAARVLQQRVEILCTDFEAALSGVTPQDAVYLDPPYLPTSDTANFVAYSSNGFTLQDQVRLSDRFKALAKDGVPVLLSNADVPTARQLYQGCRISRVEAPRRINSSGEKRGNVSEILVSANLVTRKM